MNRGKQQKHFFLLFWMHGSFSQLRNKQSSSQDCLCSHRKSKVAVHPEMVLGADIHMQWAQGTAVTSQSCVTQARSVFTSSSPSAGPLQPALQTPAGCLPWLSFPHPLWDLTVWSMAWSQGAALGLGFKHSPSYPGVRMPQMWQVLD